MLHSRQISLSKLQKTTLTITVLATLIALAVNGCATLGAPPWQPKVSALPPAAAGLLPVVAADTSAKHDPEESAFMLLVRNDDAMNWRLALLDHATSSIDAQYFIWQSDEALQGVVSLKLQDGRIISHLCYGYNKMIELWF